MKRRILLITILIELILISATVLIYNPFLKLKLIGDDIVKIPVGTDYIDKGITASFFNEDLTEKVIISNNVNTKAIGEYNIEYKIEYGNSTKKITRKVIVADLTSPEITLKGDNSVVLCGKDYIEEGFTAFDDIDGDLTEYVETKKEKDKIVYSVTDKSGNKKQVVRNLLENDNIKPTISLVNSDNLTFKQGSTYKEFGAKAYDNCDGDISSKVEIISDIDTSKHEVFTVSSFLSRIPNNKPPSNAHKRSLKN